ncbi:MAG: hypothetical protein GY801_47150 [bacterium]|nr:hypothetical protein [bacterium]
MYRIYDTPGSLKDAVPDRIDDPLRRHLYTNHPILNPQFDRFLAATFPTRSLPVPDRPCLFDSLS